MGRAPCCEKNNGLKKGPWTPEEDQKLVDYIHKHGYGNWRLLPKNAGLQRCGKSCRLRWTNYLRPDIKRGRFSFEEEEAIIQLHSILGNKWSAIASRLPGRTDNEIKNYWNTHIRKRLLKMGIDPVTHSPRLDLLDISSVLNSSLHGSSQMNLQSEILKLASSLFSSHSHQRQDRNICAQNGQENQLCNTQLQNQQISHLVQNQDSVGEVCSTLLNPPFTQTQLVESSSNMNPSIFNEFGIQQAQLSDWHCNGFASSNVTEDYYYVPQLPSYFGTESDYHPNDIVDPTLSETSTFQSNNSNQNFSFASVLSTTPSSSPTPLNSNSTYINGEDETESYVSSNNMFRFQISDILGLNEFM